MNIELTKKIALIVSFLVWGVVIFKIFQSGGEMNDQLPKCIFSTITIFAILNIFVKYLEYKDRNSK